MNLSPRIHILLSTYNGEKYLIDQLMSIFRQTCQNFTLYIRDDGSTDATLDVLSAFMKNHPQYCPQIKLLPNPTRKNLGYMESFWTLLEKSGGADYYAFCDQDDIWLPEKLQSGMTFLEEGDSAAPLLYFSNYNYHDQDMNYLHPAPAVRLPIEFKDVLFYTPAFGFSIMINETLRQAALATSDRTLLPHDGWIQKLAASNGQIMYDETCTALYRRHGTAVTAGNRDILSAVKNWISNEIFGNEMKNTHYVLKRFYQEYGSVLKPGDQKLLALFAAYRHSPAIWWKRLTCPVRFRPALGGEIALRICFFLCRY